MQNTATNAAWRGSRGGAAVSPRATRSVRVLRPARQGRRAPSAASAFCRKCRRRSVCGSCRIGFAAAPQTGTRLRLHAAVAHEEFTTPAKSAAKAAMPPAGMKARTVRIAAFPVKVASNAVQNARPTVRTRAEIVEKGIRCKRASSGAARRPAVKCSVAAEKAAASSCPQASRDVRSSRAAGKEISSHMVWNGRSERAAEGG